MSTHKSHRRTSKALTGDEHDEVNKALDWPAHVVGPGHRRYLHDPITAPIVGTLAAKAAGTDPVGGAVAATAHVVQDRASSAIRRATPKPLRWLLPFASEALAGLASQAAASVRDGAGATAEAPPATPALPPGYLLPQHSPSWFLSDQGYWVAALAPALAALLVTLDVWAIWWVGSVFAGWPEPGTVFQVCALSSWGTLAIAYPFGLRSLRHWWGTNQPWSPVRTRDGGLRRRIIGEEEWVWATRADGETTWLPRRAFPTPDDARQAPGPPEWLWVTAVLLALPLVVIAVAAFVALLMGAASGGSGRRGGRRR